MRRSIRSSLFLLVAPFALTFTLLAWVVSSKIGPWLAQPLIADCADKGYSEWLCNLQEGLMPWLFLGVGILILLSVTAILSLGLFRAHLKELQHDVLDFQKGLRNTLDPDAPAEISPLVQLLNRILQAGGASPPPRPSAWELGTQEPLSSAQNRPVTPPPGPVHTDRRVAQPEPPPARPAPEPRAPAPKEPPAPRAAPASPPEPRRTPEPPPERAPAPPPPPAPDPEDTEDLEVSLEELDADLDKALEEAPPEPRRPVAPRTAAQPAREAATRENNKAAAKEPQQAPPRTGTGTNTITGTGTSTSKNLAFPTRKCRKLIAMLGHRYPDVNFDLITDVAESDPWTIREAELTEVFGQLLDNAGKWAESQVNIFLAIKGNMLVFGVADDGPGVDPEVTQHMGEEGFRGTEGEPAGEGLVTVRRVLDAHGGSLAFDRSRLGGLEVIAAIPGSPLGRSFASKDAYH